MTESKNTEHEVLRLLEQAVQALLPVVVDLGDRCFDAQLDALDVTDRKVLELQPIAAQALPLNHHALFTIRPSVPGYLWSVRALDIAADGKDRAVVDLRGVRLAPNTDTMPDAVRASSLLVLVVPAGMNDGVDYVFPILRVSTTACEVRCSVGLAPGTELPLVEIIGDRRLLRSCRAQVVACRPYYAVDTTPGFVCQFALSPVIEQSENGERAHDLVTEPAEVKRVLKLASMRQEAVQLIVPGQPALPSRLLELGSDHAVLAAEGAAVAQALTPNRMVRLGFDLFAVAHEFDVRVIDCGEQTARTALPLILRRLRRHRRQARTRLPSAQTVSMRYRNPVTGETAQVAVTEASFYGVSFDCAPGESALWPGLPLEQAELLWQDRVVLLGDLVVESVSNSGTGRSCSALAQDSRLADDLDLIELLAAIGHPQVRVHDGADFDALHQTYLRAGLFGPHMDRNLAPIFDATKHAWHAVHAQAREVIRTFVHGPVEAPDGAVTVMRAWEHGWVLQHFVDVSTERQGATSKLQFAYLDHLVPRPDGRFMIFFVKDNNTIMNAYLRRFFESTGTAEALTCTLVDLWIRLDPSQPKRHFPTDITVEPCTTAEDELAVVHAAQRELGAHQAAAVSMTPGLLTLPDCQARFGRAGLVRERDCVLVRRGGRIAYAVLEERSTPGLNLTWMLNAAWIIPVHAAVDRTADRDQEALSRALHVVLERPAQSATGERFLNLPPSIDEACLQAHGFAREARLNFYVLNRAGLHRLFHYTAVRCGELEAMVMRRERKKQRPKPG